ncbi:MAG: amidohydrolase family protein [Acidobacteria bacterium]|nr:amidohydrolase family protein [Acidobacteriota bacterium]
MKNRLRIAAALLFACAWALPAQVQLLEGARVIDGTGRAPIEDAAVLIDGNHIAAVGRRGEIQAPAGAERFDFSGKTLVPGYIDHHFHIADDPTMVPLFLAGGVTFARDPGAWMELFAPVHAWKKANGLAGPRLSLCGPHLDGPNPAYPTDSVVILSPEEARRWVRGQIEAGATAIKVYFRLPLESVRATAEEAHRYGVPVTSHLEILDVRAAVEAGVDGVEHITSLGIALVPPMEAERYRQAVYKDNNARRDGRYEIWAQVDPHGERARELAEFLARRGTFVDPNLAVFERREKPGDPLSALQAKAWRNMRDYVGVLHRAGVPIVVGSHSEVPFAERGHAYHRELETLVEAGLTPMEALTAAGQTGARFLRRTDVGEIAPGKLADLVVLDANPLDDISNAARVHRVVMNGAILDPAEIPPLTMPRKGGD